MEHPTPNPHDLYKAPRGTMSLLNQFGITRLYLINALIDSAWDMNLIGESQALELFDLVKHTVSDSITLN